MVTAVITGWRGAPTLLRAIIGPMGLERADVAARYERYLACCNKRRFDQLGEFVDEQVSGSGSVDGLAAYVERVKAVCTGFPDYHWELQELVVEENTITASLPAHVSEPRSPGISRRRRRAG